MHNTKKKKQRTVDVKFDFANRAVVVSVGRRRRVESLARRPQLILEWVDRVVDFWLDAGNDVEVRIGGKER